MVASPRYSRSAISRLDRPLATWMRTSVSLGVRSGKAGRGLSAGRRANSTISLRVTEGASSASPRATVAIPEISVSGGESLSRNPLAPARSASKTYSSRS